MPGKGEDLTVTFASCVLTAVPYDAQSFIQSLWEKWPGGTWARARNTAIAGVKIFASFELMSL